MLVLTQPMIYTGLVNVSMLESLITELLDIFQPNSEPVVSFNLTLADRLMNQFDDQRVRRWGH